MRNVSEQDVPEQPSVPDLFSQGPYLLVALPEPLQDVVPLNQSAFLSEWVELIDPVRSLIEEPMRLLLDENWRLGNWFVEHPYVASEWLRAAARDEGVIAAFEQAEGYFEWRGAVVAVRDMVFSGEHGRQLINAAQPVLYGLAVGATALEQVGMAGAWLGERIPRLAPQLWDKQTQRDERARRRDERKRELE